MKCYYIASVAGRTVLEPREVPVPVPKRGEILVRVRAASLNRGELLASIRLHAADVPHAAGGDCAGDVQAVGDGVAAFRLGSRVLGRVRGSFAEYVAMSADEAVSVPPRLTWEQASAVPIAFVAAYEIVCAYGAITSGDTLLVAGATSGLGVACVQTGKHLGATVIGTSRSATKLDVLKSLGLDIGIQPMQTGFAEQVLQATKREGVTLAVNVIGGSAFSDCVRSLRNQGRLAVVGYLDGGLTSEIDLEAIHGKRLRIFGFSNQRLSPAQGAEAVRGFIRNLLPAFAEGRITPLVDRVFPFDELPSAKDYVETNAHVGKVVVRLP